MMRMVSILYTTHLIRVVWLADSQTDAEEDDEDDMDDEDVIYEPDYEGKCS